MIYNDAVNSVINSGTKITRSAWSPGVYLDRVYLDSDGFDTDSSGNPVVAIFDGTGGRYCPWQPDGEDLLAEDFTNV